MKPEFCNCFNSHEATITVLQLKQFCGSSLRWIDSTQWITDSTDSTQWIKNLLLTQRISHMILILCYYVFFNENDHSSLIRRFGENLKSSPRNRILLTMFKIPAISDALGKRLVRGTVKIYSFFCFWIINKTGLKSPLFFPDI